MLNLRTHKTTNDRNGISRVISVEPYIRLSAAEEYKNSAGKVCYRRIPSIFLQRGQYYSEDGKLVSELPEWAKAEVDKLSDRAMRDAGFSRNIVESPIKRKYVKKGKLMEASNGNNTSDR